MRIGVLGNAGSWYVGELQRAGRELGHEVVRLEFPRIVASCGQRPVGESNVREEKRRKTLGSLTLGLSQGERGPLHDAAAWQELSLTAFDAVIVRTMPPGSLEQVVFRMDALARLEASGVCVLNSPKAIECAVDKYLTTARLEAAGLPVPATAVCENSEDALTAFERLGGDVVVKPIFGSEGRGILRVSDPDLALRTFRTLERLQAVLYLQRFVDHLGFDIRVLVLDGRVLGGMRRISECDFRTNVSREGRGARHVVSDTEAEWSLRAAAATEARFAGVDILYDRDGRGFVIEVNAVPGWRAFQRVTEMDVARLVIVACDRQGAGD